MIAVKGINQAYVPIKVFCNDSGSNGFIDDARHGERKVFHRQGAEPDAFVMIDLNVFQRKSYEITQSRWNPISSQFSFNKLSL
jgi:hypothetical protein